MKTNIIFTKVCLAGATLLTTTLSTWAVSKTVWAGDSNATAESKFHDVLEQGGTITFKAGNWTINLDNRNYQAKGDVTIIGQNLTDSATPWKRGAYEGSFVKTTLTMTGSDMRLTDQCSNVTIKNLEWRNRGILADKQHQPIFDVENVLFDISDSTRGVWGKYIIKSPDGMSGTFNRTTFKGFGMLGIVIDRSLSPSYVPENSFDKLTFNRCHFEPSEDDKLLKGVTGFSLDCGNDEFAPTFNMNGSQIKYSKFVDCRIAISKGSNLDISNNIFDSVVSLKQPIHLEEFSYDINITDNTSYMYDDFNNGFIDLGATQTSRDIIITGNVVEQTGQLTAFVSGAGVDNVTINSNEVKNPVAGADYISFWGGNNFNVKIGTNGVNQPGLGRSYQNINERLLGAPLDDKNYYIIWGGNNYLTHQNGNVTFEQFSSAPADDSYKWKLTLLDVDYQANYFTIENVATGDLLEVMKGPTAPQQKNNDGVKFKYNDAVVPAKALRTYRWYDRKPGFCIFERNGKYCLLPGNNERRSELKKSGAKAHVYIIDDENTADYNWSFVDVD